MLQLNTEYLQLMMTWLKGNGLCDNGNTDHQLYTLKHKQAFLAIQLALTGTITHSGLRHDVDKLFLYGVMSKKEASNLHRKYAKHHIQNCVTESDLQDCIIDYECARFTKSDKPLNAYETIQSHHKDSYKLLQPSLIKMGLDSKTRINIDFSIWNNFSGNNAGTMLYECIEAIQSLKEYSVRYGVEEAVKHYYVTFNTMNGGR